MLRTNADNHTPLCVDLDGTLLKTDILWESLLTLIKKNPAYTFLLPLWLLKGTSYLKHQIARRVDIDVRCLPYRSDLLAFLISEHSRGRQLFLATGSNIKFAHHIADHLKIFDAVLASDAQTNYVGRKKLRGLTDMFGHKRYDYAGNSFADLTIWAHAKHAIVVSPSRTLLKRIQRVTSVSHIFDSNHHPLRTLVRGLRIHQWAKNVLLFVPLITSHSLTNLLLVLHALLAFLAFNLCASSGYLLNDCLDLQTDRRNPAKSHRPLASGELSPRLALPLIPGLLAASLVIAYSLPFAFLAILALYFLSTIIYSLYLKHVALVDVITLAGLYTLRLHGGSIAIDVKVSHWLLAFSMFLFFSLALVKRFSELQTRALAKIETPRVRGYLDDDIQHIGTMGAANGYISVLVLALYINSTEVSLLYTRPDLLWLVCPLLLYWISRTWLLAYRGQMREDPVVFALKDKMSYILGSLTGIIMFFAA